MLDLNDSALILPIRERNSICALGPQKAGLIEIPLIESAELQILE